MRIQRIYGSIGLRIGLILYILQFGPWLPDTSVVSFW